MLAYDAKNEVDQRVVKEIIAALDETVRRLNAPDSVIQSVPRINEVSSDFENLMRELLNATSGFSCDFPYTSNGRIQRSGYPDLHLVDKETNRVFYLN